MGHLKLCRERLVISGKTILGIHSNVAGDTNGYTTGHAWISLHTPTQDIYLGLWPDGHPRAINKDPNCTDVRINLEYGAKPLVSRYYELTALQVQKLNQFINRPDVWGYLNTCAAWATKLLRDVIGIRVSAIDYALFSTPRELGKELLALEKKSPTTIMSPRRGEVGEASFGK